MDRPNTEVRNEKANFPPKTYKHWKGNMVLLVTWCQEIRQLGWKGQISWKKQFIKTQDPFKKKNYVVPYYQNSPTKQLKHNASLMNSNRHRKEKCQSHIIISERRRDISIWFSRLQKPWSDWQWLSGWGTCHQVWGPETISGIYEMKEEDWLSWVSLTPTCALCQVLTHKKKHNKSSNQKW